MSSGNLWVRWHSLRNANDGRRDSAIGANISMWHKKSLVGSKTICGTEIGPYETVKEKPEGNYKICTRCENAPHYRV